MESNSDLIIRQLLLYSSWLIWKAAKSQLYCRERTDVFEHTVKLENRVIMLFQSCTSFVCPCCHFSVLDHWKMRA